MWLPRSAVAYWAVAVDAVAVHRWRRERTDRGPSRDCMGYQAWQVQCWGLDRRAEDGGPIKNALPSKPVVSSNAVRSVAGS